MPEIAVVLDGDTVLLDGSLSAGPLPPVTVIGISRIVLMGPDCTDIETISLLVPAAGVKLTLVRSELSWSGDTMLRVNWLVPEPVAPFIKSVPVPVSIEAFAGSAPAFPTA